MDLIGMWRVMDAAGEPAGSVLRLAGPEQPESLILFRGCGGLLGSWVASTSGGFLGIAFAFPQACLSGVGAGDPTPGWLAATRSFVVRGNERLLLAADGRVVARLLPGGHPHATKELAPALAIPPKLTAAEERKLRTPAKALPANALPATAIAIAGRWRPYPIRHYATPQQPHLSFAATGLWSGSDGCNKLGGSWRLGVGGELLSMTGASAGVGCAGSPLGAWVPISGRASISADALTFYASDGHVLGRVTR